MFVCFKSEMYGALSGQSENHPGLKAGEFILLIHFMGIWFLKVKNKTMLLLFLYKENSKGDLSPSRVWEHWS